MPSLADAQPYGPVTVPGNVHLQIGLTDPLLDDAEVISVNHDEWLFVKSFEAEAPGEGERVFLFFKGVDYFCDVWLNGTHLGSHEGMFTDFELDATAAVQPQNRLVVAVSCPWRVDSRHFFTQPSNIFSVNRKSTEYMKGGLLHYWDGAPFSGNAVFPFGIWSDVELVRRRGACIGRIAVTTVDIRDDCAELDLHCEWWSDRQLDVELDVVIRPHDFAGTGHDYHQTVRIPAGQSASTTRLTLPDPALWWTWDIGHPHLYDVSVTAAGSTTTSRFGVRLLERDPRSLAYSLNGQRLFLRGVWYPFASLFPAAADPREQQRDVDMLVEANINHIVVYTYVEADALYDACDEAGVLVFQELPFVQLGPMRVLEPDHPRHEVWWDWALDSVANILRQRRGHASLVLWCAFAETRKDGQWLYGDYTAFSDALAGLVSTLAPDAIYHPSFCDFGEDHYWEGGFPNGDFWDHYEADARFVSEYGSIAPPVLETLEEFLPAAARWGLDERTGGRIGLPIDAEEYAYHWSFDYPGLCNSVARMYEWADRSVPTLERLVDAMQWYQALGLRYCAEIYRRRRFAAFAGCRTWSYRDQIPGARFTVVDHHQRPKMGYYALKQAYAPLLLSLDERLPLAARERARATSVTWWPSTTAATPTSCASSPRCSTPAAWSSAGTRRT
jgi:beta-mannosidase